MRIQYGVCLLVAVLIAPVNARDRSEDEQAVLSAERALCAAYEAEDADWVAKHLDPDFTLTNSRGVVSTREEEAAELRSGKIRYDVFRNHDSKIRFYGDVAVVNGITTVKGESEDEAFAADFQFTDVFVRRSGKWILAASHASRLPAKP